MEANTLYLISAMVAFLVVSIVFTKHYSSTEEIRRKEGEVKAYTEQLERKMEILEQEISDIQLEIDELDEKIQARQPEALS